MPGPGTEVGVRQMLLDALLQKVWEENYPSITMLDLIESMLRPDEVPIYAAVLIEKVRDENYPSIPMLRRIAALAE